MDATQDQVKDEEQKPNISSYLQAPRKKRKNFVVIAASDKINKDLLGKMEAFVRTNYAHLAVSRPKNLKELKRQFSRSITLLVLDDKFDRLDNIMETIGVLKTKSKKDVTPVLFLTEEPNDLIAAYHKKLAIFQEGDDYCDLQKLDAKQVLGRLKYGVEAKNRRRARRFKIDSDISFFHLTKSSDFKAKLVDLSIHGAMVVCKSIDQFRVGDQVKLTIPTTRYLGPSADGEFLRISAKVRRVFMSGDTAGLSFEHVTDLQNDRLTTLLAAYARDNFPA